MIKGTYVGVRKRLRGKTALLREEQGGYLAQFDDLSQKEAHGWHRFRLKDFELHDTKAVIKQTMEEWIAELSVSDPLV